MPTYWRSHPQTLGKGPTERVHQEEAGEGIVGWAEGQVPPVLPTSPVAGISGYFRETIRQNIRQARERLSGQQLRQELARLQRRLDSVELLGPDIIMNLLLSYRDVQVCSER